MTDQTTHDVTDDDRRLARKWAESIESATNSVESTTNPWSDLIRAAVRVILDAVPTPPTLADMTPAERRACLRMQCDTGPNRSVRGFIAAIHTGGCYVVERETWEWRSCSDDLVTPRPDLPRMTWPGTEKPAPALPGRWRLADHKDNGRVIVTTQTPNDDGRVYFVLPVCRNLMGFDWRACDPDELTYLDQEGDTTTGPGHLAVGTVIESADDPRLAALPAGSALLDRDDDAVTKQGEAWTGDGYIPIPREGDEFGPWKVINIGQEADQ